MSNDTSITVERVIDAPVDRIFDLLTNPERHHEFDGSDMVRSADTADRIQSVGQSFTMNMHAERMGGDYKTDNRVTGYADDKLVAWQTAPAGKKPAGWEWVWELESRGNDSTLVRHTYDWSKVTDKDLLKRVSFPVVSEKQLEESLNELAAAVTG